MHKGYKSVIQMSLHMLPILYSPDSFVPCVKECTLKNQSNYKVEEGYCNAMVRAIPSKRVWVEGSDISI